MHSPLALVTLGQIGVPATITYLQGGTEISVELQPIEVEMILDAEDAAFALDAIAVDMAEEPIDMKVEADEITVEA